MNGDFFSARVVKARRQYFCSGCKTAIVAGSRYVTVSARTDLRYWSQWLHCDCYQGQLPAVEPQAEMEAAR